MAYWVAQKKKKPLKIKGFFRCFGGSGDRHHTFQQIPNKCNLSLLNQLLKQYSISISSNQYHPNPAQNGILDGILAVIT